MYRERKSIERIDMMMMMIYMMNMGGVRVGDECLRYSISMVDLISDA